MGRNNRPRTLKTVEHTCQILNLIKELDGGRVTELAEHLDMSKGGVYNHLATLRDQEYIVKEGDEYRLSSHFFNLGEYVKYSNPLYRVGKDEVGNLAEKTGESTHLMVEQFGKGFYYHKSRAEKGIAQEYHMNLMEEPDYLHWSSTGKAVLAEMPESRVREILEDRGMPEITERTITDPDELLAELETVREQGYAQNDEEQIRGVRAIGAAVTDRDGRVLGAISVSGPTSRINDENFHEVYPEFVLQTKNVIEVNIETRGGQNAPPS
jgi:DNA-binding IclR family transcriptional regulator